VEPLEPQLEVLLGPVGARENPDERSNIIGAQRANRDRRLHAGT
jgi:hypothetical protein